jgi:uncharacterized protein YegJ (DUF2314 family)
LSQPIYHSTNDAGRHWLTMDTSPPLQIGPVAPNHCRLGSKILRAVYEALNDLDDGASVPEEVDIQVFEDGPWVRVALPMLPGPKDWGGPDDPDEEPTLFLTVMPVEETSDEIDTWIVPLAEALDLEPDPAIAQGGYKRAMEQAKAQAQAALPSVRERFLERKSKHRDLSFGFKIGLETKSGGTEWVWIEPTSWERPERLVATLESEPHDVPGYEEGQSLDVNAADIGDYIVYNERTEEREGGFTLRIAADYGLVLS